MMTACGPSRPGKNLPSSGRLRGRWREISPCREAAVTGDRGDIDHHEEPP